MNELMDKQIDDHMRAIKNILIEYGFDSYEANTNHEDYAYTMKMEIDDVFTIEFEDDEE